MDKKFKVFVITAISLLTVGVIGAVTLIMGVKQADENNGSTKDAVINQKDLELVFLESHINSNLALSDDEIPHIVRASIAFEIYNKADDYDEFIESFSKNQVVLRDHIIDIFRNLTYEELSGEGAQEKLANLVKDEINTLFETQIIENVYFGELFVQ